MHHGEPSCRSVRARRERSMALLAAAMVVTLTPAGHARRRAMAQNVLILSYDACGTCKKARKWLDEHGVPYTVRPIVDRGPTKDELAKWIPASGKPVRKWLNTSGQSYRAKGKAAFDEATDAQIAGWLAADGKLVKRPVVVVGKTVLVGFDEDAYAETFG
jgi:arsenate reductase